MSFRMDCTKIKDSITAAVRMNNITDVHRPCLGILLFGVHADSGSYLYSLRKVLSASMIDTIEKDCSGMDVNGLSEIIAEWNSSAEIDGILPISPYSAEFGEILNQIVPEKDVDGVLGSHSYFFPCVTEAAVRTAEYYGINLNNEHVVVIGRSVRVGAPLAELLEQKGAKVSLVHSKTEYPEKIVSGAEVVFSAVGKAGFLNETYLRNGQTVIDIGVSLDCNGDMCGDLNPQTVNSLNIAYTTFPCGIGPVTSAILAEHVSVSQKNHLGIIPEMHEFANHSCDCLSSYGECCGDSNNCCCNKDEK